MRKNNSLENAYAKVLLKESSNIHDMAGFKTDPDRFYGVVSDVVNLSTELERIGIIPSLEGLRKLEEIKTLLLEVLGK